MKKYICSECKKEYVAVYSEHEECYHCGAWYSKQKCINKDKVKVEDAYI